jgi:hypothetical protein
VAAVAVVHSATRPPSIWRVTNLSVGGLGLVGDATLVAGRHRVTLYAAGFPAMDLQVAVVRAQLATAGKRCGVRFVDVTPAQRDALAAMVAADHTPALGAHRALVLVADAARARHLCDELAGLGYTARHEPSAGQSLAWLQREETEVLFVDDSIIATDRWNLLKFVRDTTPDVRRFVIANDVRGGFRLYYAMKAGVVEALVEPSATADVLARHLASASAA